jgi:hypothetical protein
VLQLGNHAVADYWELDVAVVAPAAGEWGSVVIGGRWSKLGCRLLVLMMTVLVVVEVRPFWSVATN